MGKPETKAGEARQRSPTSPGAVADKTYNQLNTFGRKPVQNWRKPETWCLMVLYVHFIYELNLYHAHWQPRSPIQTGPPLPSNRAQQYPSLARTRSPSILVAP